MKRGLLRLPWLAAALFVAAAAGWLARDRRIPREAFQAYSVYNTSPSGLSLAFRYLDEGRTVKALIRPVERAFLEADAVVFRVAPDSSVPPGLRKPRAGGT